jgi:hypothetical protein
MAEVEVVEIVAAGAEGATQWCLLAPANALLTDCSYPFLLSCALPVSLNNESNVAGKDLESAKRD